MFFNQFETTEELGKISTSDERQSFIEKLDEVVLSSKQLKVMFVILPFTLNS